MAGWDTGSVCASLCLLGVPWLFPLQMRGSEDEAFNPRLGMPAYPLRKTPGKYVILWTLWVWITGSGATLALGLSNTVMELCISEVSQVFGPSWQ